MSHVQQDERRPAHHYHHGRTPAAWAGSAFAAVGFVLAALAFMMGPNWLLIWIGFGLVALGVIVGGVLRKLGFGQG